MENKEISDNSEFIEALEYCRKNNLYLGEGNPNAKILIIGQECAINEERLIEQGIECKDGDIEKCVVKNNLDSWNNIIKIENLTTKIEDKKAELGKVKNKNDEHENCIKHVVLSDFYPFFPHLGQKCSVRGFKQGKITGAEGTARTWYAYQLLVDLIRKEEKKENTNLVDFHNNCFHTELNQLPLLRNNQLPKNREHNRRDGITKRAELLKMPFFKKFPIVILACGPYPEKYNFNINETFDVKDVKNSDSLNKEIIKWCRLYRENKGTPRILIHTKQLSFFSQVLLKRIAEESKDFI